MAAASASRVISSVLMLPACAAHAGRQRPSVPFRAADGHVLPSWGGFVPGVLGLMALQGTPEDAIGLVTVGVLSGQEGRDGHQPEWQPRAGQQGKRPVSARPAVEPRVRPAAGRGGNRPGHLERGGLHQRWRKRAGRVRKPFLCGSLFCRAVFRGAFVGGRLFPGAAVRAGRGRGAAIGRADLDERGVRVRGGVRHQGRYRHQRPRGRHRDSVAGGPGQRRQAAGGFGRGRVRAR